MINLKQQEAEAEAEAAAAAAAGHHWDKQQGPKHWRLEC